MLASILHPFFPLHGGVIQSIVPRKAEAASDAEILCYGESNHESLPPHSRSVNHQKHTIGRFIFLLHSTKSNGKEYNHKTPQMSNKFLFPV